VPHPRHVLVFVARVGLHTTPQRQPHRRWFAPGSMKNDNNPMKQLRCLSLLLLAVFVAAPALQALEKQPASVYHARREALAAKLHGGVAILFAAEEAQLDFDPYRQDEDFYYLTGWNEPGAALVIVPADAKAANPREYTEILFLPTRDLRLEKYTGPKLDAFTPNVTQAAAVDAVQPMTALPLVLNRLIDGDRSLLHKLWTQPAAPQATALTGFLAATLGISAPTTPPHDVTAPVGQLRLVKDAGEIALLRKASDASIAAQRAMMRAAHPGVTERAEILGREKADGAEIADRPGLPAAIRRTHRLGHILDDAQAVFAAERGGAVGAAQGGGRFAAGLRGAI